VGSDFFGERKRRWDRFPSRLVSFLAPTLRLHVSPLPWTEFRLVLWQAALRQLACQPSSLPSGTSTVCDGNSGGSGMPIKFDDYMAKLPKKRQQDIRERAAELIAEEATLRQLREARERSQVGMARKPLIKQAAASSQNPYQNSLFCCRAVASSGRFQ